MQVPKFALVTHGEDWALLRDTQPIAYGNTLEGGTGPETMAALIISATIDGAALAGVGYPDSIRAYDECDLADALLCGGVALWPDDRYLDLLDSLMLDGASGLARLYAAHTAGRLMAEADAMVEEYAAV